MNRKITGFIFNLILCVLFINCALGTTTKEQEELAVGQKQVDSLDTTYNNKKLSKKKKQACKNTAYKNYAYLTGGLGGTILAALLTKERLKKWLSASEKIILPQNDFEEYMRLVEAKFKNKKHLRMVIGAGDQKHDYTIRFTDYDFVLCCANSSVVLQYFRAGMEALRSDENTKGPILLPLDFTNQRFWQFLDSMPECFSEITFDFGVTKYASTWNGVALTHIATALEKGGTFCFPEPSSGGSSMLFGNNDVSLRIDIARAGNGIFTCNNDQNNKRMIVCKGVCIDNSETTKRAKPLSPFAITNANLFGHTVSIKPPPEWTLEFIDLEVKELTNKYKPPEGFRSFMINQDLYKSLVNYIKKWYPEKSFSSYELKQGKYPSEDKQWVKHPMGSASFEDVLFSVFTK